MSSNTLVPEPTLRRLPWYLAYLKSLKNQGESHVSSTNISKVISVTSTQIAKDLSHLNISGKTRVGYDVNELVNVLEDFLGFKTKHTSVLFGVGSLGAALLSDFGLEQFGLKIYAGFDINPSLINTEIHGIPIYDYDAFCEINKTLQAEIGILTVPSEHAQQVAEKMIAGDIKAIWNFTPFRIRVPDNVVLQNTSLYAHLAVMYNRLHYKKANP